jgi:hypothetical protein
MAPISLNALASSLPQLSHGVLIILVVIIGILLIVITLISLGLGQQAVGWVIDQWQHLGLCQHLSSPHHMSCYNYLSRPLLLLLLPWTLNPHHLSQSLLLHHHYDLSTPSGYPCVHCLGGISAEDV